jgi:hypothetical protein
MENQFRWALRKLHEIGVAICSDNSCFVAKTSTEVYSDLSKDPEIKILMESMDSKGVVRLAQKALVFRATH